MLGPCLFIIECYQISYTEYQIQLKSSNVESHLVLIFEMLETAVLKNSYNFEFRFSNHH